MKRYFIAALAFLAAVGPFVRCSDPLSADEGVVRELFRGLLPMGRYSVFWDGTDDGGNLLSAGTYYVRLESRDFTYQIEMTATAGGTGEDNSDSYYVDEHQGLTNLAQNVPNPFQIEDGTNIRFTIDQATESVTVILTIRDRE